MPPHWRINGRRDNVAGLAPMMDARIPVQLGMGRGEEWAVGEPAGMVGGRPVHCWDFGSRARHARDHVLGGAMFWNVWREFCFVVLRLEFEEDL